jgi:hypothetical protein
MYSDRRSLYDDLAEARSGQVLVYVTGDRPGLEAQVHPEVLDLFVHHLDKLGQVEKIVLVLHTRGGNTLAAWSIVNLIRQFCSEFEVVVPSKAHSAGTLICLGADRIVMTKQATLGPIDPSVNGPLNPQIPGAPQNARFPVSVEAINGYVEFLKAELGEEQNGLAGLLQQLSQQVHPLVLGNAYRSRSQIRMLAKKLITRQVTQEEQVERVLAFLCSESGSHDYAIYRQEARDELGLRVERPDDDGYRLIKQIYDDVATELELTVPYDPMIMAASGPERRYSFRRGLIESVSGGSHVYRTEGVLRRQQVQQRPGLVQNAVQDERTSERWHHESA